VVALPAAIHGKKQTIVCAKIMACRQLFRALVEGLTAQQSDAEFNAMLDKSISMHFRRIE